MSTTGAVRGLPAREPAKAALPKAKTPPSLPTSQYPPASGVEAMATIGAPRAVPAVDPWKGASPKLKTPPSLPSSHVVIAATVAAVLWFRSRRLGLLGAAYALAVGVARLYRGAHWPTDVLASLLFASVWLGVCVHVLAPSAATPVRQELHRTVPT